MKSTILLLGILLIVLGVATLSYQGFSYNKEETVAQIGNLQVTANTQKRVSFPPYTGFAFLAAGIVLVLAGRKAK